MNQAQDRSEDDFYNQELVLWHPHDQKRSLAIPGVVVRKEEHQVIIRARVEGTVREIAVPPDELVER